MRFPPRADHAEPRDGFLRVIRLEDHAAAGAFGLGPAPHGAHIRV